MSEEIHDLRNLLTIVMGQIDLADADLARGDAVTAERLQKIRTPAADCCLIILGSFFASERAPAHGTFDLNAVARKIVRDASEGLGAGIEIYLDLSPHPTAEVMVAGDALMMFRLMLNLVLNARNAIVKAEHKEMGIIVLSTRVNRSAATLTVLDNGCGLSQEELIALNQPLPAEENTRAHGHGFAMVRKEVRNLGGLIAIRSELGVGSAFAITVPLNHPQVDERVLERAADKLAMVHAMEPAIA